MGSRRELDLMGGVLLSRSGAVGQPSVWTPKSVPGIRWWYDISQITGIGDGGSLALFPDYSGNNIGATQIVDSSFRPIYKTAIKNGHAVARFDGANDNMVIPELLGNSTVDTCSLFVVFSGGSTNAIIATRYSGLGWTYRPVGSPGIFAHIGFTNCNLPTAGGSTWAQETIIRNGLVISPYLNGTHGTDATLTGFNPNTTSTHTYIGGEDAGGSGASPTSNFFNGDIGEIIAYNTVVNSTNRAKIELYLKTKWGTP